MYARAVVTHAPPERMYACAVVTYTPPARARLQKLYFSRWSPEAAEVVIGLERHLFPLSSCHGEAPFRLAFTFEEPGAPGGDHVLFSNSFVVRAKEKDPTAESGTTRQRVLSGGPDTASPVGQVCSVLCIPLSECRRARADMRVGVFRYVHIIIRMQARARAVMRVGVCGLLHTIIRLQERARRLARVRAAIPPSFSRVEVPAAAVVARGLTATELVRVAAAAGGGGGAGARVLSAVPAVAMATVPPARGRKRPAPGGGARAPRRARGGGCGTGVPADADSADTAVVLAQMARSTSGRFEPNRPTPSIEWTDVINGLPPSAVTGPSSAYEGGLGGGYGGDIPANMLGGNSLHFDDAPMFREISKAVIEGNR